MEPFFGSPQCHGCFLLRKFCLSLPTLPDWALPHSSGSPSSCHLPDASRWSPGVGETGIPQAELGALPSPAATYRWAPSSHLSCKHSSQLSQKEKKKNHKKSGDNQFLQFLIKGVLQFSIKTTCCSFLTQSRLCATKQFGFTTLGREGVERERHDWEGISSLPSQGKEEWQCYISLPKNSRLDFNKHMLPMGTPPGA